MLGKCQIATNMAKWSTLNKVSCHRSQPPPFLMSKGEIVMNGLNGRCAKGERIAKVIIKLSLLRPIAILLGNRSDALTTGMLEFMRALVIVASTTKCLCEATKSNHTTAFEGSREAPYRVRRASKRKSIP
jgi:hypothetical protein